MCARVHGLAVCACMCASSTARVRLFMRMHSPTNEHASSTIRPPSPRPKVRYVASARHHQRDPAVFRKLHHTGKHITPCPLPLSLSPATWSHTHAAFHSCPCLRPPLTPFFSCSCAPSQAAFSSSQVNWKCKAPTLPHPRSFFEVILGCNFGGRYGGLLFAWVKRTLQPR